MSRRAPARAISCLIIHPGSELYGSDRVLLESAQALSEDGFALTVLLPAHGPLVARLQAVGARVEIVPLLVLRKSLLRPTGLPRLLWGALRDTVLGWRTLSRIRPSVVYVNTVTLPVWPVIARLRGVPTLLHVHEGEQGARRIVKRLMYAPALAARAVIVNSRFSNRVIAEAYPSVAAAATVVANAVPGPAEPTEPRPRIDGALRVVYVGRLSPRKGPDVAVEAISRLARRGIDATLDLVGDAYAGYEWYSDEIEERISANNLSDAVFLRGFHADVWPYLAASDVVVIPSRLDEPFGNTVIEAVLAIRPAIVSDTSGLRESGAGFASVAFVPPDDPGALADQLERLRGDWERIREKAVGAAVSARDRYSPTRYGTEIVSFARALAERTPLPHREQSEHSS